MHRVAMVPTIWNLCGRRTQRLNDGRRTQRERSIGVEAGQECRVVRGGGVYEGQQELSYSTGISAQSAGSSGLCLHTLVIPPGGRAKAHLHENHESAIYMISGSAEM